MRKIMVISGLSLMFCLFSCNNGQNDYWDYVDPFVGTAYTGHTFPGATIPFGMMQPGPQTGNCHWDYCSGYVKGDSLIQGFSQNRLNGTGCPDLGDILMMPFTGTMDRDNFYSTYDKQTEMANVGYYAVDLLYNQVGVEITTTPHVSFHRYTFQDDSAHVAIDFQSGMVGNEQALHSRVITSDVTIEDEQTISFQQRLQGWVGRQLFGVIKFDVPMDCYTVLPMKHTKDKASCYVISFPLSKGNSVLAKVAFSTVSIEQARKNMKAELNDWNFEHVCNAARMQWKTYLSRIEIEGTKEQKTNFYTAMYHLFIQPNNIADVDGMYRGVNDSVMLSESKAYYSTFSLWDTYRCAHPMYIFLAPERVPDMVNSMLHHAEVQGFLPIWTLWGKENYCMIGNHAVPVVTEAIMKNMPGIDVEWAFQLIKKTLSTNHLKSAWDIYNRYGYYPYDLIPEESVSRTLESCYDDYCASQLAHKLGKLDDYEFFSNRSFNYKNLFDNSTGFMRGKDSRGNWRTPFDPYALSHAGTSGGDFTEGNACQYTWHVQHDIPALIELIGGKEKFKERLDLLFIDQTRATAKGFVMDVTGLIGQYAHGNEPSHHIAYLYTLAGYKWRTDELIRQIFDSFYHPRPDGLCGNDDCGQMSAWYMFSALGFYPIDPVSCQYILGAPQLPKATIHLQNGKDFTVIAENLSAKNKYVKKVRMNGKDYNDIFISYEQIMDGGTLTFEMCDTPQ